MAISLVFLCALSSLINYQHTTAKLASPCPQVFSYESINIHKENRWHGIIKLRNLNTKQKDLQVKIFLDEIGLTLKAHAEKVTTSDFKEFEILNPMLEEDDDGNYYFRIKVKYNSGPNSVVPKLMDINLNGEALCILKKEANENANAMPSGINEIKKPNTFLSQNIFHTETSIQQYPWHAAIYEFHDSISYLCGGTLITKQHVITTAQCLLRKSDTGLIDFNEYVLPSSLIVYLGLQNRRRHVAKSIQALDVIGFSQHPHYNSANSEDNLSILKLVSKIRMTDYVRPICLREESDVDIEGRYGNIVQWGNKKTEKSNQELNHIQIQVACEEICNRDNQDIFGTSNVNTFCAGFEEGITLCQEDTGTGMVFPKANAAGNNTVWQLGGIISLNPDLDDKICDTRKYVTLMDVSRYLPWIRKIVGKALDAISPKTQKKCGLCGVIANYHKEPTLIEHIEENLRRKRELSISSGDDGVCCSRRTRNNTKELWYAARDGKLDIVKSLLCAGEDPNGKYNDVPDGWNYGVTPLMEAAFYGHIEVMRTLIEYGADVNIISRQGYSALMMSTYYGGENPVVKLLLDNAAYVHQISIRNETALSLAIKWKMANTEMLIREALAVK